MVSELDPAYHGEARLLRWNESGEHGRTIALELEDASDTMHPFKPFKYGKKNGQRFAVVLVPIADNEEPRTKTVDPMVREAGILCGDNRFRRFCSELATGHPIQMANEIMDAEDVVKFVREYCGIESRKELADNADARAKWQELRRDFNVWMAT